MNRADEHPSLKNRPGNDPPAPGASRVLVVEDRTALRQMLTEYLTGKGYQVDAAGSLQEGLVRFHGARYHMIVLDLKLPDGSGMELLRTVRQAEPTQPVILMTAYGSIEESVQAIKYGAVDFIQKPLNLEQLHALIQRGIEFRRLEDEVLLYREEFREARKLPLLISRNPAMEAVARQLQRMAATGATILLLGESGTGKELFARTIHLLSPQSAGPFVEVNCAAIPETLIENELFGHVRGAYTGAESAMKGKFELAIGGTLFLDEIGDMPVGVQAKLLKALEEKRISPIGGTFQVAVDVRIVVATNRDLETEMAEGRFRRDLFFRIGQFTVSIPPLRERPEDIQPLAEHFLREAAARFGRPQPVLDAAAVQALERYAWPGNVRELKNLVERAVIIDDDGRLDPDDLFPGPGRSAPGPLQASLEGFDRIGLDAWLQREQAVLEREALARLRARHPADLPGLAAALGLTEAETARRLKRHRIS
ncbi:MAG TPA: sigma-54 dependent transcriptional regulator [Acidobacteriota bacterium]|nr:sigma-54 dependent transcriptional regulator [Acidobacteriota bacterium]HQG91358.1 sigma-54 dependent transcriptional regulator [Acidobacteriota bacterium]